jgi:hypothetical protein
MNSETLNRWTFIWTTAEGRKVRLCDMDSEHLINVIWWVMARRSVYPESTQKILLEEANYRDLAWQMPTDYEARRGKIEKAKKMTEEYLSKLETRHLDLFLNALREITK